MQKTVDSNHGLVLFNPYIGSLSNATTLGQSGHGSGGNEEVLRIPVTSPSDSLVSYPGHLLWMGVLPLYREVVSVFYSPSRLDNFYFGIDNKT